MLSAGKKMREMSNSCTVLEFVCGDSCFPGYQWYISNYILFRGYVIKPL